MIGKNKTDKIGLGKLTIYTEKGQKPTISIDCPRGEAKTKSEDLNYANGTASVLKYAFFNGKQIFPDKTFTLKQLCEYLDPSPQPTTVRNWASKGKIPYFKASEAKNAPLLFKQSIIDKWIKNGRPENV